MKRFKSYFAGVACGLLVLVMGVAIGRSVAMPLQDREESKSEVAAAVAAPDPAPKSDESKGHYGDMRCLEGLNLKAVYIVTREAMIREWIKRDGSPFSVPLGFYDPRDRTVWVTWQPSIAYLERILGHEILHAAGMVHDERGAWDLTPLQLE